jgi:V8-like Glu-specific endopeptidase
MVPPGTRDGLSKKDESRNPNNLPLTTPPSALLPLYEDGSYSSSAFCLGDKIVTALHCVASGKNMSLRKNKFDGPMVPLKFVDFTVPKVKNCDIAWIPKTKAPIEGLKSYPGRVRSDAKPIKVGDVVWTYLANQQALQVGPKSTNDYCPAKGLITSVDTKSGVCRYDISTDEGHSGSPVFDADGFVIGVHKGATGTAGSNQFTLIPSELLSSSVPKTAGGL